MKKHFVFNARYDPRDTRVAKLYKRVSIILSLGVSSSCKHPTKIRNATNVLRHIVMHAQLSVLSPKKFKLEQKDKALNQREAQHSVSEYNWCP